MQWFSMLTVHSNHMGIFKKVLMLEFFLQIKQSLRAGLGISNLKKFPGDSKALANVAYDRSRSVNYEDPSGCEAK